MLPWLRPKVSTMLIVVSLSLALIEDVRHENHRRYVGRIAQRVVSEAGAVDNRAKVIALRDYIRTHVSKEGISADGRPFLRDSAADTLKSGRGYCGEASRSFIAMARELGIPAQRINLTGRMPHVVADAEIAPGLWRIVDSQNPPQIVDLEPLDIVILRPEFDDYYTINLRRLHISWFVSRIKFQPGPLTNFLEYPHKIKVFFWVCSAMLIGLMKASRLAFRLLLLRRGWVHVSNREKVA